MNYDTISTDTLNFIENYFSNINQLIDTKLNFFEEHQLFFPKKNHLFTLEYLLQTRKYFLKLDSDFESETLKKIAQDIVNFKKELDTYTQNDDKVYYVFVTDFTQNIQLLKIIGNKIKTIRSNAATDISSNEKLKTLLKHQEALEEIYYEYFQNNFLLHNKDVISSLKLILNLLAYYFDQLLWIDANKSDSIKSTLKLYNDNNYIDSKAYITYRLKNDISDTGESLYLKQCLRRYK